MSKKRKIYFISGAILITLCLIALFTLGFYGKVFFDKENKVIYVYHEEGKTQFETELGINSFMWNCALIFKRFPSIKPGKYTIQNGMNYYEIIDLLRSGNQTPIKFRTDNVTSVFQLAGKFGKSFESDSIQFLQAVKNILPSLPEISSNTNEEIQLQSIIAYINGDTYEFLWTATP
ncbi:MAG: endolytic transglycosylase MltG, partial [Bacteroidota bacterium]